MSDFSKKLFEPQKRNGFNAVREAMNGTLFLSMEDCRCIAKREAEGKSREELVEFLAEMLCGIGHFRQAVVNTHLFGSPDARL